VNVLDENVLRDQRELLLSWHVPVRQIGHDFGKKGLRDEAILTLLHQTRKATFFTRDLGFFDPKLCHSSYCLVCLNVDKYETAVFARRTLRHTELNTQAKRSGTVVRVSHTGIAVWRIHAEREERYLWK
jgi:hypothetical protein